MDEREPTRLKRLLDRFLAARARRDREVRLSDPWRAAEAELHAIERTIFRPPVEPAEAVAATSGPSPLAQSAPAPQRGPAPPSHRQRGG
jgi:hypothetical protein